MKYNEQHAITMLNALQDTETLKEHDKEIRKKAIDEFYNLLINNIVYIKAKFNMFRNEYNQTLPFH